ncbi:uncharacterized protein [Montipora capricornis]|uniref:uncharacterized protein n=1 Tax=Montipora capricornis TaxID=246305 RepID=UPI0035F1F570
MAKARENVWVPRLRRLVKKLRGSCNGCKKFQAKAYQAPPPGSLPITRTQDFLASLKRFIARRGRPEIIYSDNGFIFKAATKWLQKVHIDEKCHAFLAENSIKWKFNLSRAPWWGGQFERLIGLFKNAFYKSIGNGTLRFPE